jgi:hypothetical protein
MYFDLLSYAKYFTLVICCRVSISTSTSTIRYYMYIHCCETHVVIKRKPGHVLLQTRINSVVVNYFHNKRLLQEYEQGKYGSARVAAVWNGSTRFYKLFFYVCRCGSTRVGAGEFLQQRQFELMQLANVFQALLQTNVHEWCFISEKWPWYLWNSNNSGSILATWNGISKFFSFMKTCYKSWSECFL